MDAWFGVAAILVGLAGYFYGYPLSRIFLILAGLIYGYLFGHSFVPASHPWLSLAIGLGAALGFMILSSIGVTLNASQGAVILLGSWALRH